MNKAGKCRYTGKVVITQGTLHIQAHVADIFLDKGQVQKVVLYDDANHQVQLHQLLDDGSPMDAQANRADYLPDQDTVLLTGNYRLTSPKGTNTGQSMAYNTRSGDMQSGGDGNRVHTVILPKNIQNAPSQPSPTVPSSSLPVAPPQTRP